MFTYFEGRGAERKRERESQAGSTPSTKPNAGLYLMIMRSQLEAKIRSQTLNWLSHLGTPRKTFFDSSVWSLLKSTKGDLGSCPCKGSSGLTSPTYSGEMGMALTSHLSSHLSPTHLTSHLSPHLSPTQKRWVWLSEAVLSPEKLFQGCLGGSVSLASVSWFWLRSWSHSLWDQAPCADSMEPPWSSLSISLSAFPLLTCTLSLSPSLSLSK